MIVNHDSIRHPSHYKQGEIEAIDFIEQVVKHYPPEKAYHIGNTLKYIARAPHKGSETEDLAKAINYLERAITGKWRE